MLTDKANAICLLEILKEFSDEQHILPMREIINKLQVIYGIKPDRRTVYGAVALLIELGYDISTYEENGEGYFLRSRELERSEILLLTDAVYTFPFIPAKQSEELIAKLQKTLSSHQRKQYRHLTIVRQEHKTDNRQMFWNIEQLDGAIAANKQVSFTYLDYGMDKHLHPRREKPYVVNPYGMVYTNEHYYLICNLSGYPNTSLYRIDRMKDICRLDTDLDNRPDTRNEARNAVFAFTGKPERISMLCDKSILGDVLDKFGTEVWLSPEDEKRFRVSFEASPKGIKYWALQYLQYAEVMEPKWLREEILEGLRNNPYQKGERT